MVKNKKTWWLCLLVLLASFYMPLLSTSPVYANLDQDKTDERNLIILKTFKDCITGRYINDDTGDATKSTLLYFDSMWETLDFAGKSKLVWDAEIAKVGFSIDSDNGVWTCKNTIYEGLEIMGLPSGSEENVISAFTDGETNNFDPNMESEDFLPLINSFRTKLDRAISDINRPSSDAAFYLNQRAFFADGKVRNLANICFSAESGGNTSGEKNFNVTLDDGTKVALRYRGDDAVQDFMSDDHGGWINDDGVGGRATRIGDISFSSGIEDFNTYNDGFFPAYDSQTDGEVSCSYLKSHKALLETNVILSGSNLVLTDQAIVDEQNQQEIDETLQDKLDALTVLFEDKNDVFAFCTVNTLQAYADNPAIAGLDFDFASGDITAIKNYVLEWLAAYQTEGVTPPSVPWTDAEGEAMIKCLGDALGSEFYDTVDVQPEDLQDIEELSGGEPDPEDVASEEVENCKGGSGVLDTFLGFIICPIVEGILRIIDWAQNTFIIPYLAVNPLDAVDDNAVFLIWKIVRNISYVLLIVAFMYLIFAETTSFGGEAYQLKRMAPRLVLVTIGITLSFYIVGLIIDFFNILGIGIGGMTAYVLDQSGAASILEIDTSVTGFALTALLAGTGASAVILALLSGSISAPAIGIAALAGIFIVLGVIVTLLLRQILIMALVMLTPIAFVAALLPNTEKFFKMWWSYLSKALVMYPLIMLLFAGGKIFAAIITTGQFGGGSGNQGDALRHLMAFMANIVPLVMVPFTFKFAGGVLGSFYGSMRGAVSKGRNAGMGDPHNPNSIRGGRSRVAAKWAARGERLTTRMAGSEADSTRARFAGLINRAGHFTERAAKAKEERGRAATALINDRGGKAAFDVAAAGLDLAPDEQLTEEILGRSRLRGEDAEFDDGVAGLKTIGIKSSAAETAKYHGLRTDLGAADAAFTASGHHSGGNRWRHAQMANVLRKRYERGDFGAVGSEAALSNADGLWKSYTEADKKAGHGLLLSETKGDTGRKDAAGNAVLSKERGWHGNLVENMNRQGSVFGMFAKLEDQNSLGSASPEDLGMLNTQLNKIRDGSFAGTDEHKSRVIQAAATAATAYAGQSSPAQKEKLHEISGNLFGDKGADGIPRGGVIDLVSPEIATKAREHLGGRRPTPGDISAEAEAAAPDPGATGDGH